MSRPLRSMSGMVILGEFSEVPFRFVQHDLMMEAIAKFKVAELYCLLERIVENRTVQQNRSIFKVLRDPDFQKAAAEYDAEYLYKVIEAEYWRVQGGYAGGAKLLKDLDKFEWMVFWPWFQQFSAEQWGAHVFDPDPIFRTVIT